MGGSRDSYSEASIPQSKPSSNAGIDGIGGENAYDLLEKDKSFKASIFGVVYAISEVKWDRQPRFAALRLVLEYLQLFVLIGSPELRWTFNPHVWLWKVLRWLVFVNPVKDKGEGFFQSIFYLAVGMMVFGLLLCLFIGWRYQTDKKQWGWPVLLVQAMVNAFCVFLYPASLALLVTPLDCRPLSKLATIKGFHATFHYRCMDSPYLGHMLVALASAVVFISVTLAALLSDYEGNPLSTRFLATSNAAKELVAVLLKAVVVATAVLLEDAPKFQSTLLAACMLSLVYTYLHAVPYHNAHATHCRVAMYGSLLWVSGLMAIMSFTTERVHARKHVKHAMTTLMLAGLGPSLPLAYLGSCYMLKHRTKGVLPAFRASLDKKLKDVWKFHTVVDVEVAHRCCRVNMINGFPDPEYVQLAERILKAGMLHFANNAYMILLNANFVVEVMKNTQSGISLLQSAKKARPNICLQYLIFCREQTQRQNIQKNAGNTTGIDLLGYVEFQRSVRMAIRRHKEAVQAARMFWKLVGHRQVKFSAMLKSFKVIKKAETQADRMYRMVLERYPASTKLMRCYGLFLQEVKNDPWTANKYFSEADRCEHQEEDTKGMTQAPGRDHEDDDPNYVDERTNAVVVINTNGIIQFVSNIAVGMFGYQKHELEGKNVSMLMPAPFSARHNGYLRNYVTSGGTKSQIVGRNLPLVALHKERYVFPFKLHVTVLSSSADDTLFMGRLTRVEETDDVVRMAIVDTGTLVCVDRRFTDWFGSEPEDCVGKQLVAIAVPEESQRFVQLLHECKTASLASFEAGNIQLKGTRLLHKYLKPIMVDIVAELGGSDANPVIILCIRKGPDEPSSSLVVTDDKGRVHYASSSAAELLGLSPRQLIQTHITRFIPFPFNCLHHNLMQNLANKPAPSSCRSGMIMTAVTANNINIAVKLDITAREEGDQTKVLVQIEKASFKAGLEQRCLVLHLSTDGVVTHVASGSALFGLKPAQLLGHRVDSFVDVFEQANAAGLEPSTILSSMLDKSLDFQGMAWRVALHVPAELGAAPSAPQALTRSKSARTLHSTGSKAGVMLVDVMRTSRKEMGAELEEDEEEEQELLLTIYRADLLLGSLEVDTNGFILKPGMCPLTQPGFLFGCSSSSMMRCSLDSYLALGQAGMGVLMEPDINAHGPTAVASFSKPPAIKQLTGQHADGGSVKLNVQAVFKDASMRRLVIRINLVSPQRGNLGQFLHSLKLPYAMHSAPSASSLGLCADALAPRLGGRYEGRSSSKLAAAARLRITNTAQGNGGDAGPLSPRRVGVGANANSLPRAGSTESGKDVTPRSMSADLLGTNSSGFALLTLPPPSAGFKAVGLGAEGGFVQAAEDVKTPPRSRHLHVSSLDAEEAISAALIPAAEVFPEDISLLAGQRQSTRYQPPPLVPMRSMEGQTLVDNGLYLEVGEDNGSNSSAPAGEAAAAAAASSQNWQSDFKAGKQYRRLMKQLNGANVQRPMEAFKKNAMILVAALLAVHLLFYVIFTTSVTNLHKYVFDVDAAGQANDYVHLAALGAQVLRQLHVGRPYPPFYTQDSIKWWADNIMRKTQTFEEYNSGLYLGFGHTRRLKNIKGFPLQELWEMPNIQVQRLLDTTPPSVENVTVTLWDLSNLLISSLRELAANHEALAAAAPGGNLSTNRDYFFVNTNLDWNFFEAFQHNMDGLTMRAMEQIEKVNRMKMVLLVLEALVVCSGAMMYMYMLLAGVAHMRYSLFSSFLFLPVGVLRCMATRKSVVGLDDGGARDHDDSDNEAMPAFAPGEEQRLPKRVLASETGVKEVDKKQAHRTSAQFSRDHQGGFKALTDNNDVLLPATAVARLKLRVSRFVQRVMRGSSLPIRHKVLIQDSRDTYLIMVPIILWFMAVFAVYMVSYFSMEGSAKPLISLNLADRVQYRITRVTHFAHKLSSADTDAAKESLKPSMVRVTQRLQSAYRGMLYGQGPSSDSRYSSSGSAFSDSQRTTYFFRTNKCLRAPEDPCLGPSSPYYSISRDGIDAMMHRFIDEAILLSQDAAGAIAINSSRMDYLWLIGRFDLHNGFRTITRHFVAHALSIFQSVVQIHTTLFGLSWVAGLVYVLGMFLPFCRRSQQEVQRIAQLLSQLPGEVPVQALVEEALGIPPGQLHVLDKSRQRSLDSKTALLQRSKASPTGDAPATVHKLSATQRRDGEGSDGGSSMSQYGDGL